MHITNDIILMSLILLNIAATMVLAVLVFGIMYERRQEKRWREVDAKRVAARNHENWKKNRKKGILPNV